jgi:glucosyl-3-phosphoglycerate synthase
MLESSIKYRIVNNQIKRFSKRTWGVKMDFNQGKITTIHDFDMDFENLQSRLGELKKRFPTGVVIPLHENDLSSTKMQSIITGLNKCDYLKKVLIALSASSKDNYEKAMKLRSDFKVPCEVVWCNKPEVNAIFEELKNRGLDVTKCCGKGKDMWLALGIASLDLYAVAMHDADIVSYSEMLPTKLLYSIVEPRLDFFFAKGYYARVNLETRRIYGRVYRLFISPLMNALQKKMNHSSSFIRYLQSFRYPLSGEIAIYLDVALNLRIPADWGLEMGMLAELYRNISDKRICDVDLGLYDHKHKELSQGSLLKTAENCLITVLRTLTEIEGIDVSEAFLLSLQVTYRRFAQDKIRQYNADALCNSLYYDRHEEENSVDALAEVIIQAGRCYLSNPVGVQLPDWLRTISAMPDIRERLKKTAIER